jgi:Lrp/AsnC family transcriptional regulator, leucine-responsive regulatory protein
MPQVDSFDAKLLTIVQENNRLTVEEMSRRVGLSASACQRRLSRLRAEGFISADISVLDPRKVGKPLIMVIEVTLEREDPVVTKRFKDAMRKNPKVMQCYYVTGEKDFILLVAMRDMEEFNLFQTEFCTENPMVNRFSTSVVVEQVKVNLAIPVQSEQAP